MFILTIRTDKPEAEIGLYDDDRKIAYETWQAHRQLAETIHQKIIAVITSHCLTLQDITGIVCFKGPGSFTGLRIGLAVANALSFSLSVPIIGTNNENWIKEGVRRLRAGENEGSIQPEYGSPVHVTAPRK